MKMEFHKMYSLEWLDSLITVTLNPDRAFRSRMTDLEIRKAAEMVPAEALQVQQELNHAVFSLIKDSQATHTVTKYHSVIASLCQSLKGYKERMSADADSLSGLEDLLLHQLTQLNEYIATRFGRYLEKGGQQLTRPAIKQDGAEKSALGKLRERVLCTLSGDQIALILRAADETQLLKAKSMNAVFQSIIPHLSTPVKEELSASSIRSKAYSPEEADRDITVRALEALIKKIKGY